MTDVLIDSSVWIEYFRSGKGRLYDQVDLLLDRDRILLCGMVELEILQGMRSMERKQITSLFSALHYVETERSDFQTAGELLSKLRNTGITIPATDCLIATICLRLGLFLFCIDKHFDSIKKVKRYKF